MHLPQYDSKKQQKEIIDKVVNIRSKVTPPVKSNCVSLNKRENSFNQQQKKDLHQDQKKELNNNNNKNKNNEEEENEQ